VLAEAEFFSSLNSSFGVSHNQEFYADVKNINMPSPQNAQTRLKATGREVQRFKFFLFNYF
jgi:hypothetical protein